MTQKLKSNIDLESLLNEIQQIDFWVDGSEARMCVRQGDGIPFKNAKTIMAAVKEIGALRNIPPLHLMINKLPSGVVVPIHKDWLKPSTYQNHYPVLERWHLIVKSNNDSWWWDEDNGTLYLDEGHWYGPMSYWKNHQVGNLGTTERIHLIVDLDSPIPIGKYK